MHVGYILWEKFFIAIVSHVWLWAWSPEENMSFKLFCLTSKAAQSKMFDFQSYFIMSQKEEVTAGLYKVKEDFVIYHYRATCKDIIWKEGMTLPGVAYRHWTGKKSKVWPKDGFC
jgi:hypothetical protein